MAGIHYGDVTRGATTIPFAMGAVGGWTPSAHEDRVRPVSSAGGRERGRLTP